MFKRYHFILGKYQDDLKTKEELIQEKLDEDVPVLIGIMEMPGDEYKNYRTFKDIKKELRKRFPDERHVKIISLPYIQEVVYLPNN